MTEFYDNTHYVSSLGNNGSRNTLNTILIIAGIGIIFLVLVNSYSLQNKIKIIEKKLDEKDQDTDQYTD